MMNVHAVPFPYAEILTRLLPPPKLKHEQGVEPLGMIDPELLVLIDQSLNHFHVEVRPGE